MNSFIFIVYFFLLRFFGRFCTNTIQMFDVSIGNSWMWYHVCFHMALVFSTVVTLWTLMRWSVIIFVKSYLYWTNLNWSQVLDWFVQMCLAVKYIHDRKILHRDIKAQVKLVCSIDYCSLMCITLYMCIISVSSLINYALIWYVNDKYLNANDVIYGMHAVIVFMLFFIYSSVL